MDDPIEIRPLRAEDAPAVAALWMDGARDSAAVDPSYTPGVTAERYARTVAEELGSGQCLGWGAFAPGAVPRLLAYLTAQVAVAGPEFRPRRFLYLLDLDVDRTVRRQALGSRLVAAAQAHARAQGLDEIEVSWLMADARAAAFWQRQGFQPFLARGRLRPAPPGPRST